MAKDTRIIKARSWTNEERISARLHAEKQSAGDDSDIDYSDIPRLTDEQLAQMVPLRNTRLKVPVSVRLEPRVIEWLKLKGQEHLTHINDTLRNVMEAEERIARLPRLRAYARTISLQLPVPMIEHLKILANKRYIPYQSLLKGIPCGGDSTRDAGEPEQ